MPRLTEEQEKRIRELQEMGLSDGEISKMMDVPYHIVHQLRLEVKKKMKKYRKMYYTFQKLKRRVREFEEGRRKPRLRVLRGGYQQPPFGEYPPSVRKRFESDWREFLLLLELFEGNCAPDSSLIDTTGKNIYLSILEALSDTKYGKTHEKIVNYLRKNYDWSIMKDIKRVDSDLRRLRNLGLVDYNRENERYSLTDKGRQLCKYLFNA